MSVADILAANRIVLKNRTPGSHKTTCPKCSGQRHNKTDPCLSVTIHDGERCVWHCHHCGWSGGARSAEVPAPPKRKANPRRDWLRRLSEHKGW